MVVVVSDGRRVDIDKHRVAGKITVIDFYADWCEACRHVDAWLALQQARHDDIALRKINVVDWESPVAKQYLRGRVPELPYLRVYDADGELVDAVYGGRISLLRRAFERARQGSNASPSPPPSE